jgi:hypothetical protein
MIARVAPAVQDPAEQARLREAGAAFEALILQQMLAGIMPSGTAAADLATQSLARDLAEASPFGIARLLETRA